MVGTPGWTTPTPSTARELSSRSGPGARGELASFQGPGPGKVTTLVQSRSCELRGKNVNEDTILNVEPRTLCELAP